MSKEIVLKKLVKKLRKKDCLPVAYFLCPDKQDEWFLLSAVMEFGRDIHNTKGMNGSISKMKAGIRKVAKKWVKIAKDTDKAKKDACGLVFDCYEQLTNLPIKDQVFLTETIVETHKMSRAIIKADKDGSLEW